MRRSIRLGAGVVLVSGFREVISRIAVPAIMAFVALGVATSANASLIIAPTFDSTITGGLNASAVEASINAAIAEIEGDITSPNNISVSIYFTAGGGLGGSNTSIYGLTYQQYYNALAAIATQPNQQIALASLGPAPTGPTSGNPLTGSAQINVTSAEARNLGFSNDSGGISVGSGLYDSEITVNTSLTYPPQPNNGNTYGLQAVVTHEMDEALGIGGTGSDVGGTGFFANPGDLDLYRYTCSDPNVVATLSCPAADVTRTYSAATPANDAPYAYFSINGGLTVLSFFNQTAGADYGDWLSNCTNFTVCQSNQLPDGFSPQVQDAYGVPGTNPVLGVNELTAFNAIGYELVAPEPSTLLLVISALAMIGWNRRRLA